MRRITSWNFHNNFTLQDFIAIRYSTDLTDHGKDCVTRQNILREFRRKFMFATKTVTIKEIVLFLRKSSVFYFRLYSSSPEEALSTLLFSLSEPLEFEEVPLLLASSVWRSLCLASIAFLSESYALLSSASWGSSSFSVSSILVRAACRSDLFLLSVNSILGVCVVKSHLA